MSSYSLLLPPNRYRYAPQMRDRPQKNINQAFILSCPPYYYGQNQDFIGR